MVTIQVDHNIILARALLNMMRSISPDYSEWLLASDARAYAEDALRQFNAVPSFSFDQDYITFKTEADMTMFLLRWG